MSDDAPHEVCPRCEDLLREGNCRGCCPRCQALLVSGGCPACPPQLPTPTAANLLHEIGELLDLRQWPAASSVNSFLALGWILLRVAHTHDSFLVGWLRTSGAPDYPSWYEDEIRKREALLEAFSAPALEVEAD